MAVPPEVVSSWSKTRWLTAIGVTCGIQFALVLMLTNRSPIEHRVGRNTLLTLPSSLSAEIQSLTDPTLFALGGPHGFSRVWMDVPSLRPVDARWEEEPDWRELDPKGLGSRFLAFAASTGESAKGLVFKPFPESLQGQAPVPPSPLRSTSSLRLTGDLGGRRLAVSPELPSWPAPDLLRPSKVRVVVDNRGTVMSAILLSSSSSPNADQFALKTAGQLRFLPSEPPTQSQALTFGEVVFDWHTLPREEPADLPTGL